MRIILIGKAGAGKDTVAEYLVAKHGFHRYAFADKLKEIARELFPEAFTGAKPRSLLQDLGAALRQFDPDVWTSYLLRRIEADGHRRVVISDCRYRNELVKTVQVGFIPVLVDCADQVRAHRLLARGDSPLTPEQARHSSERDVFACLSNWPEDLILDNTGTLGDLHRRVDALLCQLNLEDPNLILAQFRWVLDGPAPASPAVSLFSWSRPSWQSTFLQVARTVALRSTCLRRQVGAVLVKDNRIIATGYNGAPKGLTHCTPATCLRPDSPTAANLLTCRAVHAEENCIIQAATFGVSTIGSELYVTCHPCLHCAKTLVNAGISRVYYADAYPDQLAAMLFAEAGVEVICLGSEISAPESAHVLSY